MVSARDRARRRQLQSGGHVSFPDGLEFIQVQKGRRKIWRVKGVGVLDGFTLDCDPPTNTGGSSNRGGDPSPPKNPAKALVSPSGAASSKRLGDPDGI